MQGTLGEQVSSAEKLVNLQAARNQFSALGLAFLEASSKLPPKLTFVDISDNQLKGTVPEGLVRHTKLLALYAQRNFFSVLSQHLPQTIYIPFVPGVLQPCRLLLLETRLHA